MKHIKRSQSGFTLVEIAIVLVIIGLLLGGVLKGQELIVQSKIKNAINDFNGVATAIYSYQDRYRQLPGDDPNAATRWTAPITGQNGNGNGQIAGGAAFGAQQNNENGYVWQHLRLAGFVTGSLTNQAQSRANPTNAFGGQTGVKDGSTGATLGLAGMVVCLGNLPAKAAEAIDSQLDDGSPGTGLVRAILNTGTSNMEPTATPAASIVDNGTNLYTVCKQL